MPTFKEKVAEFIRQLSTGNDPKCEMKSPCTSPTTGTFIHRYLSGEVKKNQPDILFGKSCYDLPVKEISRLSPEVSGAYTGPAGGLTKVNRRQRALSVSDPDVDFIDEDSILADDLRDDSHSNDDINQNDIKSSDNQYSLESYFPDETEEVAGIPNWNRPSPFGFGIATTLYECHPFTRQNAGEPIADAFGICVRANSALMALADGVNWGEKSCLAARCAVHGCMDYLNKALYREGGQMGTTLDVFVCLLRSFHAAHNLILQENGLLTTLCAAVICQLKDSDKFIVCTCNVGDSLAYVFSQTYGVREITQGSHDIYSMRDMRDALGALGPVDGSNPELNNLTVAMTVVEEGDIVFLTSDGISDNFDPVVGKFALAKKPSKATTPGSSKNHGANGHQSSGPHLSPFDNRNDNKGEVSTTHHLQINPFMPMVEAHQRHELTLLRMEDLLRNGVNEGDGPCETAKQLCENMIDFATKLTVAKRRILEDPDLYHVEDPNGEPSTVAMNGSEAPPLQVNEQRMRRRKVGEKLAMVPGKLDHASVVAYQVTNFNKINAKEKITRKSSSKGSKKSSSTSTTADKLELTREPKKEVSLDSKLQQQTTTTAPTTTVVDGGGGGGGGGTNTKGLSVVTEKKNINRPRSKSPKGSSSSSSKSLSPKCVPKKEKVKPSVSNPESRV